MKFEDVIKKRRSIRSFETKPVPKSVLKLLVQDAIRAPSSSNMQPWQFYVVTTKNKRDKIAKLLQSFLSKKQSSIKKLSPKLRNVLYNFYADMGSAQNIIFVYVEKDKKKRDSMIMGVSAAAENLMLSATNKGLGTCWVGSFRHIEKELNNILKIKNKELVASIIIGYPKKGYVPLKRSKKKLSQVLKFL